MFISLFFLVCLVHAKQIKNIDFPACRNCIYHKPLFFSGDYSSSLNKCDFFGKKDLLSNKITYDYADMCRFDENKCGSEGKYFEEDPFVEIKMFLFHLKNVSPYLFFVMTINCLPRFLR